MKRSSGSRSSRWCAEPRPRGPWRRRAAGQGRRGGRNTACAAPSKVVETEPEGGATAQSKAKRHVRPGTGARDGGLTWLSWSPAGTPAISRRPKWSARGLSADPAARRVAPASPASIRAGGGGRGVRRGAEASRGPSSLSRRQQFPPSPKTSIESPQSGAQAVEKAVKSRFHDRIRSVSGNCCRAEAAHAPAVRSV